MGLIINTNLNVINSKNILNKNTKKIRKSMEKLSSGFRINHAADDSSGLAVSEKMRLQITGLDKGIENADDGISLLQTADGHLNEVCDMLDRLKEISIKSTNGIYGDDERNCLQNETDEILDEIDRIGDTANFNQMPIFRGTDTIRTNPDNTPVIIGQMPYNNFSITDTDLAKNPFNSSDDANTMNLQAVIVNKMSGAYGQRYNLVFGNGDTSSSSIRIKYYVGADLICKTIPLKQLSSSNYIKSGDSFSRKFQYTNEDGIDISIAQKIDINAGGSNEKSYDFTYNIENNSTTDINSEFMFHVDTAYNNNDLCEEYYVNGSKITNFSVYSDVTSPLTSGVSSPYIIDTVPSSLSIVNSECALPFTEKITFDNTRKPDSLSVGFYSDIDKWSYYDDLTSNLGNQTRHADLGMGAYWNDPIDKDDSKSYKFSYGIANVEIDNNLSGVTIKKDDSLIIDHLDKIEIPIQINLDSPNKINVSIDEMNTSALDIESLDVTTSESASRCIENINNALEKVISSRGKIGSQQNRLEHVIDSQTHASEIFQQQTAGSGTQI